MSQGPYVIGALLIGIVLGGLGVYVFQKGEADGMDAAMQGMTVGLEDKEGTEFEQAFLNDMILHHEGAVAMAQMVLEKTQRPELVQLANDIISAQTKEISTMRTWITEWFGAHPSH